MNKSEKIIGYLKYSGENVKDGLLDIRKSSEALLGFDEILRYFLIKEDPSLKEMDFEIPVKIRKGSWEAVIPEVIDKLLSNQGILMAAAGTYLTVTAKKAASDGLLQTGIAKDIKTTFKVAIKSAQWMIKIASHLGTFTKRKFENIKFENIQNETLLKIPNEKEEYLSIPKKYFDLFKDCPEKLFAKNARIVEKERSLEIGLFENDKENSVIITESEKKIFYTVEDENQILFPHLKHGQSVELEGGITRGNEKTNTIGFEYMDHILTCRPQTGNIASFKEKIISQEADHFFPKVKIFGTVDRTDKEGDFKEKRPQIIFTNIIPLEIENKNLSLFDK